LKFELQRPTKSTEGRLRLAVELCALEAKQVGRRPAKMAC